MTPAPTESGPALQLAPPRRAPRSHADSGEARSLLEPSGPLKAPSPPHTHRRSTKGPPRLSISAAAEATSDGETRRPLRPEERSASSPFSVFQGALCFQGSRPHLDLRVRCDGPSPSFPAPRRPPPAPPPPAPRTSRNLCDRDTRPPLAPPPPPRARTLAHLCF